MQGIEFEADALLINETIAIYAGTLTPNVDGFLADMHSRYISTDGFDYKKIGAGPLDWVPLGSGAIIVYGKVPVWLADGTPAHVPLLVGQVPVWLSDGTYAPVNIEVI